MMTMMMYDQDVAGAICDVCATGMTGAMSGCDYV